MPITFWIKAITDLHFIRIHYNSEVVPIQEEITSFNKLVKLSMLDYIDIFLYQGKP